MKQIIQYRSYKIDVIVYLKVWQMNVILFEHEILLVIPENDDNLEDILVLPLLLLSTRVINCL